MEKITVVELIVGKIIDVSLVCDLGDVWLKVEGDIVLILVVEHTLETDECKETFGKKVGQSDCFDPVWVDIDVYLFVVAFEYGKY